MTDTQSAEAAPAPAKGRALTGSCHCGAVRYEATAELGTVVACNCSICAKKGTLLAFTGEENFRLVDGEGRLSEYRFNRHVIGHMFCTTCGVEPFARGIRPDGARMVALNVRCIDGVELDRLNVRSFDGRSL